MARPLVSNSLPRLLEKLLPPPEVSRSLIATSLVSLAAAHLIHLLNNGTLIDINIIKVPSLCVKSVVTRSRQSCSSASCPSSAWSVKLLRTSNRIFASSHPPSVLSKSPLRPTWSPFSKTPTCALSTPSVSPSSPRISSLPVVSVASAHRFPLLFHQR